MNDSISTAVKDTPGDRRSVANRIRTRRGTRLVAQAFERSNRRPRTVVPLQYREQPQRCRAKKSPLASRTPSTTPPSKRRIARGRAKPRTHRPYRPRRDVERVGSSESVRNPRRPAPRRSPRGEPSRGPVAFGCPCSPPPRIPVTGAADSRTGDHQHAEPRPARVRTRRRARARTLLAPAPAVRVPARSGAGRVRDSWARRSPWSLATKRSRPTRRRLRRPRGRPPRSRSWRRLRGRRHSRNRSGRPASVARRISAQRRSGSTICCRMPVRLDSATTANSASPSAIAVFRSGGLRHRRSRCAAPGPSNDGSTALPRSADASLRIAVAKGTPSAGDTLAVLTRGEIARDFAAGSRSLALAAESQARDLATGALPARSLSRPAQLTGIRPTGACSTRSTRSIPRNSPAPGRDSQAENSTARAPRDATVARANAPSRLECGCGKGYRPPGRGAAASAATAATATREPRAPRRRTRARRAVDGVVLLRNFGTATRAARGPVVTLGDPDRLWMRVYVGAAARVHPSRRSRGRPRRSARKAVPGRSCRSTRAPSSRRAPSSPGEQADLVFGVKVASIRHRAR